MPTATDLDPSISHAIADGWANFAEAILPGVGGDAHAEAHIAFHFGAMYVLQILEQVVEHGSAESAALALSTLGAELDEFKGSRGGSSIGRTHVGLFR
jgi:hypothetical protein